MNWKSKAAIMRLFAALPYGDRLYKAGQKRFGRLDARPMVRLPAQAQMLKWLRDAGKSVEGMRLFEVGTGHVPVAPIGFFLCGAGPVVTVDLHRRIDWNLTRDSLRWISEHRKDVWTLYDNLVPEAVFNTRFELLSRLVDDPQRFFKEAGIDYRSPMDAADTGLPDHSVDCHFSMTVLEHIPPDVIRDILTEAKRILVRGGGSDPFCGYERSLSASGQLHYAHQFFEVQRGRVAANCRKRVCVLQPTAGKRLQKIVQ